MWYLKNNILIPTKKESITVWSFVIAKKNLQMSCSKRAASRCRMTSAGNESWVLVFSLKDKIAHTTGALNKDVIIQIFWLLLPSPDEEWKCTKSKYNIFIPSRNIDAELLKFNAKQIWLLLHITKVHCSLIPVKVPQTKATSVFSILIGVRKGSFRVVVSYWSDIFRGRVESTLCL